MPLGIVTPVVVKLPLVDVSNRPAAELLLRATFVSLVVGTTCPYPFTAYTVTCVLGCPAVNALLGVDIERLFTPP